MDTNTSEHKFTDDNVLKALELCHIGGDDVCLICPYAGLPHCCWLMDKDAIDLIFRQKAEIERLQGVVLDVTATLGELEIRSEHIKAQAIKEFAERLATKIVNTPFGVNCSGETESYKDGCLHGLVAKQNNVLDIIYDLVKEMTEEHYETQ